MMLQWSCFALVAVIQNPLVYYCTTLIIFGPVLNHVTLSVSQLINWLDKIGPSLGSFSLGFVVLFKVILAIFAHFYQSG